MAPQTSEPASVEVKLFSANGGTQVGMTRSVLHEAGTVAVRTRCTINPNGDQINATFVLLSGTQLANVFNDPSNHQLNVTVYP